MTTAVDDLVSLFAAKLRMDGTWVSPVAQGSRNVHVEYHGDHLTLVLPEGDLSTLLAEGDELARDLWPDSCHRGVIPGRGEYLRWSAA